MKNEQRRAWSVERGAFSALGLFLFLFLFLSLFEGAAAQEGTVPAEEPDAAVGVIIFNERCMNCHGPRALGDGELAVNLPNPPAALASLEYMRAAVPADMFTVVTNGRIERGMPPFGPVSTNPLADADRWNAIAAVFSLGTPIERVEQGQAVYEANCLACHGEGGAGDGPEAASATVPDLSGVAYWSQVSNQAVFDGLHDASVAGHDFVGELEEDSLWAVVDYVRTFSYAYTDALAAFRPIENGVVSGQVLNGTTGEVATETTTAELRAFNQQLEVMLTMTTTVSADGRFEFQVSDVAPEWLYRVAVDYQGLDFGSEINQLSRAVPEIEMPVTVYDQTSDASAVSIDQMHLILAVADDTVQVNEVYVFSNSGTAVFVGEEGDAAAGTVKIALPAGAENATFERGFGSFDSFFPADEVMAAGDDWVDTLPLRPGDGSLILLANYSLPYDSGMTVSHPVYYDVRGANLVLEDVGVELAEGGGWATMGAQNIEGGSFFSYSRAEVGAGESFEFELSGRPRSVSNSGTAGLVRDNNQELMIGGVALLAVVGAAVYAVRSWRQEEEEEEPAGRMELLEAIAELDDAYEQGEVGREEYETERQQLKEELMAVWAAEGE